MLTDMRTCSLNLCLAMGQTEVRVSLLGASLEKDQGTGETKLFVLCFYEWFPTESTGTLHKCMGFGNLLISSFTDWQLH